MSIDHTPTPTPFIPSHTPPTSIYDPTAPLSLALRLGVLELINSALALVQRDLNGQEVLHPHAYQILKDFLPKETYKTFLSGAPDASAQQFLNNARSELFRSLRLTGLSLEDCTRLSSTLASDQLTSLVERVRARAAEQARAIPSHAPQPRVLEHPPTTPNQDQVLEDALR